MTKTKFNTLELNQKYESRIGEIWEVIEKNSNPLYSFRAKNMNGRIHTFTAHGESHIDEINDDDLIYKIEPQMTKTKLNILELNQKYESRIGEIWEVFEKKPNPLYPFRAKDMNGRIRTFTPHGEVYTDEINDDDLIYKIEPQMTTIDISIDIRTQQEPTTIIFSDPFNKDDTSIAYKLTKSCNHKNHVLINDNTEYVLIESKEHAENLKKALDKAIELGWLK